MDALMVIDRADDSLGKLRQAIMDAKAALSQTLKLLDDVSVEKRSDNQSEKKFPKKLKVKAESLEEKLGASKSSPFASLLSETDDDDEKGKQKITKLIQSSGPLPSPEIIEGLQKCEAKLTPQQIKKWIKNMETEGIITKADSHRKTPWQLV